MTTISNLEDETSYDLIEIKSGLAFYYEYLNQVDPEIFSDEKFPITRGEIISTLRHLNNIPDKNPVFNLVQSHPLLTHAMESIEDFKLSDLNSESEKYSKYFVYTWMEYLLFTACNILYHKFQFEYRSQINNKHAKEVLKLLIEKKANFKNDKDSYSRRYLKLVNDFIEIEIEKNKSLNEIEATGISNEASELILSYLNQIKDKNDRDDLYSSLNKKEFDNFIFKFKRLLFIPSYFDITKSDRERVFHIFLLGVLEGKLEDYHIKSNKESGLGRYDICLNPLDKRNPGVIIEIKKVNENLSQNDIQLELDSAIQQIVNKNYMLELFEDNIQQVIAISLVFNGLEPNIKWILKNKE